MCVNRGERANEEVSGCGRKVESKIGKGRRRREGQNVGEEKADRGVDGEI